MRAGNNLSPRQLLHLTKVDFHTLFLEKVHNFILPFLPPLLEFSAQAGQLGVSSLERVAQYMKIGMLSGT